ncbi:hypothetical protein DL765_000423 [Monosporascus sp. GIB2]|nr:hypothetical protein DL765_000423 [Monosporascus sp. GIB2]
MGWAKHFEGKDLVELYEAGAGPVSGAARVRLRNAAAREEQQRLARLGESFDREMARCAKRLEAAAARYGVRFSDAQWAALDDVARLLDADLDLGPDGGLGGGDPAGAGSARTEKEAFDKSVF